MNELIGQKIVRMDVDDDSVYLGTEKGDWFSICHMQDCCEYVRIYDAIGNLDDIMNEEIIDVEINNEEPTDVDYKPYDSYTWTQFVFVTRKGVYIQRWLGESNGYYSENVYFQRTHAPIN